MHFEPYHPGSFDYDESSFSIFNEHGGPQNHQDNHHIAKVRKRQANKESAIRSRLKKKAMQEQIENEYQKSQQEVNKLKLENAALRAENQLLKRYLSYFENLFAKKTGANVPNNKEAEKKDEVDLEAPSVPVTQY